MEQQEKVRRAQKQLRDSAEENLRLRKERDDLRETNRKMAHDLAQKKRQMGSLLMTNDRLLSERGEILSVLRDEMPGAGRGALPSQAYRGSKPRDPDPPVKRVHWGQRPALPIDVGV